MPPDHTMNKKLLKRLRELVQDECENYCDGYCLYTRHACQLMDNASDPIDSGRINCDYFQDCVMPADWDVNDLIEYAKW